MAKQCALELTKYKGKSASYKATLRRANGDDLSAFVGLQAQVLAAMPNQAVYIPSTEQELFQDVTQNLSIGIWVENADIALLDTSEAQCTTGQTLIAYMTVRYDGKSAHNYANYLDVSQEELPYWANMDSVLVLPAYRGNQLQQRLFEVAMQWREPHIIGIACTISPENQHSLANAKASGYEIYTRRIMYGKHDRYVLHKRLAPLPGKYRHFKGNEYRVLSIASHSETLAPMVVYQALYGEQGVWVRPQELWFEWVERDSYAGPRFVYLSE